MNGIKDTDLTHFWQDWAIWVFFCFNKKYDSQNQHFSVKGAFQRHQLFLSSKQCCVHCGCYLICFALLRFDLHGASGKLSSLRFFFSFLQLKCISLLLEPVFVYSFSRVDHWLHDHFNQRSFGIAKLMLMPGFEPELHELIFLAALAKMMSLGDLL